MHAAAGSREADRHSCRLDARSLPSLALTAPLTRPQLGLPVCRSRRLLHLGQPPLDRPQAPCQRLLRLARRRLLRLHKLLLRGHQSGQVEGLVFQAPNSLHRLLDALVKGLNRQAGGADALQLALKVGQVRAAVGQQAVGGGHGRLLQCSTRAGVSVGRPRLTA